MLNRETKLFVLALFDQFECRASHRFSLLLMYGEAGGSIETLAILLKDGQQTPAVNMQDDSSATPLMLAVAGQRADHAHLLLRKVLCCTWLWPCMHRFHPGVHLHSTMVALTCLIRGCTCMYRVSSVVALAYIFFHPWYKWVPVVELACCDAVREICTIGCFRLVYRDVQRWNCTYSHRWWIQKSCAV